MQNFHEIKSVSAEQINATRLRENRYVLINRLVGSPSEPTAGTVTLYFTSGLTYTFKSQNCARRLNDLYLMLLAGKTRVKKLEPILKAQKFKTIEDLEQIKVKIELENGTVEWREADYIKKQKEKKDITFNNI